MRAAGGQAPELWRRPRRPWALLLSAVVCSSLLGACADADATGAAGSVQTYFRDEDPREGRCEVVDDALLDIIESGSSLVATNLQHVASNAEGVPECRIRLHEAVEVEWSGEAGTVRFATRTGDAAFFAKARETFAQIDEPEGIALADEAFFLPRMNLVLYRDGVVVVEVQVAGPRLETADGFVQDVAAHLYALRIDAG